MQRAAGCTFIRDGALLDRRPAAAVEEDKLRL